MSKPETNTKFLVRLMEFSKSGAMAQLFIMDAIAKQAAAVAKLTPAEVKEAFGEHSLIHPVAWLNTAREIDREFKERQL